MFIQVIQGRAINIGGIRDELDRWRTEVAPGAKGWLGSTSGVTDDGRSIAIVRFESEAAARRNSERPEQGAWWERMSRHIADPVLHDSARVHTFKDGGSDRAGFVQIIQGHSDEMEHLAVLALSREDQLTQEAPHILGMTVAEHADRPGDFTQAVYFTSEEDARRWERDHPAEAEAGLSEIFSLMTDLRYFDLRDPWLQSAS